MLKSPAPAQQLSWVSSARASANVSILVLRLMEDREDFINIAECKKEK